MNALKSLEANVIRACRLSQITDEDPYSRIVGRTAQARILSDPNEAVLIFERFVSRQGQIDIERIATFCWRANGQPSTVSANPDINFQSSPILSQLLTMLRRLRSTNPTLLDDLRVDESARALMYQIYLNAKVHAPKP